MQVKTKAIVLSAIKFQEKSLIVKCFTLSDGLKSYFIPNAFAAKKANQKIAYFQLLNILDIEVNHKNKGTLEYFKDVKLAYTYQNSNVNIVKTSIILFLSEVLHNCILEEEKNENLFVFIETSLQWLDTNDTISNFHLIFLLQLTKFLGFYPNDENVNYLYFETIEGFFSPLQGTSCLNEFDSGLLRKLLSLNYDNSLRTFSQNERQHLLTLLISYYSIHLQGFKKPKSLEVLTEIFN